jgi:C-terminal processing protease CtpA/Prc
VWTPVASSYAARTSPRAVVCEVALHHPGDDVVLLVERDGQRLRLPFVLSSYAAAADEQPPRDEITAVGRARVSDVTDVAAALMGTSGRTVELSVLHADGTRATVEVAPQPVPSDSGEGLYPSLL